MAESNPNRAHSGNATSGTGIPGSASQAHPSGGIPLPAHGFDTLDEVELATLPPDAVISRAASLLMAACAETLGLSEDEPDLDLVGARRLIDALAGLLAASRDTLGEAGPPLVDGLRTLQSAYREASAHPDEPGKGPGEHLLT